MGETRLEKLLERKAQLDNRIKRIQAKEKTQERKRDTRRKILIGGTILALVKRGEWTEAQLVAMLDRGLSQQRDRLLFGLDAEPEPEGEG